MGRLFLKFEFFREIRGDGIATVRPYLVANREMTTDGQTDGKYSQEREARLNTKAFVIPTYLATRVLVPYDDAEPLSICSCTQKLQHYHSFIGSEDSTANN